MSKQLIISLGREFGSGGQEIAKILADRFQLPLYQYDILKKVAEHCGVDVDELKRYDEKPKNHLMYRTVKGFNNSPGDAVAQMQFHYLRELAGAGKSFVVLGRCAEEVLKGTPGLVTIFVQADLDFRTKRTMESDSISEVEAKARVISTDRKRRAYHDQYCKGKWGYSINYDITVNSARLGIEGTANVLEQYIRARVAQMEAAEADEASKETAES